MTNSFRGSKEWASGQKFIVCNSGTVSFLVVLSELLIILSKCHFSIGSSILKFHTENEEDY